MTDLATALATRQLTPFEGDDVIAAGVEIPGAAGGLREAMQIDPIEIHKGEKVYVVLECTLAKIRHDPIKDTQAWRRVHILETNAAAIVDGSVVREHLEAQATKIRLAREAAEGTQRLVGADGDDSVVNPSLVDGEFAEDEEAAVLERQHNAGAHGDGLRTGCPQCDAEAEAVAAEQADEQTEAAPEPPPAGTTPITKGRRSRAKP